MNIHRKKVTVELQYENTETAYSFVLNCRGLHLARGWIFFYNFIKWWGGNRMTNQENCSNPEGSRSIDDPTRWC